MHDSYRTTFDKYGNGDSDEADGLEARLDRRPSLNHTEEEGTYGPVITYVPVISPDGRSYHKIDFERSSVEPGNSGWNVKKLRKYARDQKLPLTRIVKGFDYKAYAATMAERNQKI